MITRITGTIVRVDREYLTLEIEAMHYEILISEMVRRQSAKRMVDDALATEKTFKNFQALMEEVYHQQNAS